VIFTIIPKLKYRFLPIKPDGDGCMPLSAALHWIASNGLASAPDACVDASDQYQAVAKEFSAKVISGRVRIIGADNNQMAETLPPLELATVQWSFFFNDDDYFSDATTDVSRIVIMPCGDDQRSEDQYWAAGDQPRLTMLQVFKEDIRREWPFKCSQSDLTRKIPPTQEQTPRPEPGHERRQLKPGTKPKFDWAAVKQKTFELMEYHGNFLNDDPKWNALARLEEAIREQMNIEPAESTLRTKAKEYYDEWLTTKLGTPPA
jgi:hypothetical protein